MICLRWIGLSDVSSVDDGAPITVPRIAAPRSAGRRACGRRGSGISIETRSPVAAILVAEHSDQVALLELDADQDVAGGRHREQQVASRHRRRRPEGEQEAQIDRMAHHPVKQRRVEFRRRQIPAEQAREHLAEAEQLEMAEHEGAGKQQRPAEQGHRLKCGRDGGIVHRPDRRQASAATASTAATAPDWRTARMCCARSRAARSGSTSA